MKNVTTRFAPSPTGFLHIGGVRTALFSYLYGKQNKGKFILRIEDTDKARNKEEWTTGLIDDLLWLGLKYDLCEKQSDRLNIHKKYLQKMIDEGFAYISKETPTEPGQRDEVIRFKNPNKKVTFTDVIRGEVTFDTTELGDFIIARSADEPLYHLAVVVDDFEMNVTHIIRAEEHLSNTPRQILIQEAIGAERPVYAHLPLVLASDKTKLSKRKHGESVSLTYYRKQGYLPEAIINFVALLGWNPGTEQEIFSMQELIDSFSLEKVQKGGAVFNVEKLNWVNKEYIKKLSHDVQKREVESRFGMTISDTLLTVIIDRIEKWSDVDTLKETGELSFVYEKPILDNSKIVWKDSTKEETLKHIDNVLEILQKITNASDWTAEFLKKSIWDYATEHGRGNVLWPIRYILSGKDKSPDPFVISNILGKEETLSRLTQARQFLA